MLLRTLGYGAGGEAGVHGGFNEANAAAVAFLCRLWKEEVWAQIRTLNCCFRLFLILQRFSPDLIFAERPWLGRLRSTRGKHADSDRR